MMRVRISKRGWKNIALTVVPVLLLTIVVGCPVFNPPPDLCAGVDCDDGDACTGDACAAGVCSNDPVECAGTRFAPRRSSSRRAMGAPCVNGTADSSMKAKPLSGRARRREKMLSRRLAGLAMPTRTSTRRPSTRTQRRDQDR